MNYKSILQVLFWAIVTLMIVVLSSFIYSIYHNVSEVDRLYFSIQGFTVENNESITIGRNSNVSYDQLPCNYMKITKIPGSNKFRWEVNDDYKDSLFYYKVGNVNPNLTDVASGDCIRVDGKSVDAESIKRYFDQCVEKKYFGIQKQQSVNYIMVRNIFALEMSDTSYLSRTDIKSFFWRNSPDENIKFCVLDNKCKIRKANGDEFGYCYNGYVSSDSCKIQFYEVSENSYMLTKPNEHAFSINGICYTAKPIVLFTEWGSGHIKVDMDETEKGMRVFFQKPITLVERIDKLIGDSDNAEVKNKLINIGQNSSAFPMTNTIYMPTFSNLYNIDVCSIDVSEDRFSIYDNSGDTISIESRNRFTPDFDSVLLKSSDVNLKCKVGFIDGKFVRSFLYLPFSILLLFLIFFFIVFKRAQNMAYFDNKQKLITNMGLSVCVFIIAFIYCLCKILIALKLSYTYPYFEKISEINVISVSLSLVFIFVLYSMFSQRFFRTIDNKRNIKNRPRLLFPTSALSLFFSLIGFSLILALWHFNVDNGFSANVLMSYMKEDLFTLNIFDWTTLSGMNDTHRSVLYALSMFIIVAMFITLLMHISVVRRCFYALFHSDSVSNKKMWIVIIITAGLLFSCILLPGNFATAFITLVLVIGLSLALACVDYDKPLRAFMSIIVMVVLFGMFSILPDNGYITNWGGVLLAICWLVVLNSVKLSNYVNKDHKKSYIWLAVSTFVFVALLVSGSVLYIMNKSDNNNVNYDRMNRRFDLLLNYNDVKDKGFRYSESDVEFMVVMAHYMQNNNGDDPLSNDKHLLHPSISTGQSPVVLNDVSIQSSFFSAYGWKAKAVYFTLLLLLVFTVCFYVNYSSERETSIGMVRTYYSVGTMDVRRMLAVFMWVGTSLYLYMSYCGYLPFTGRLNPGFGVDSVGEVLESALLIAFMMSEDVK